MTEDLTKRLPENDSETLALILATVQATSVRVDSLEQTVKVRVYDTQPILRKVIADIAELRQGQQHLQEGQRRLEEGQENLRSELKAFRKKVDYSFLVLSGEVLSRYMKLEQRVTLLELNSNPPNTQA